MFFTAGDYKTFTWNFGLAGIRLSEVYCNRKNIILKSVGKTKEFHLLIFVVSGCRIQILWSNWRIAGTLQSLFINGCNLQLMRSSLLHTIKILLKILFTSFFRSWKCVVSLIEKISSSFIYIFCQLEYTQQQVKQLSSAWTLFQFTDNHGRKTTEYFSVKSSIKFQPTHGGNKKTNWENHWRIIPHGFWGKITLKSSI